MAPDTSSYEVRSWRQGQSFWKLEYAGRNETEARRVYEQLKSSGDFYLGVRLLKVLEEWDGR